MDAEQFDTVARTLAAPSRRAVLGFALAGGLGALADLFDADAKKGHRRKKKRKKKSCTPTCTGKSCGDDGCGGSCGSCQGGDCQGGNCVCPFGKQCSPGLCCANEQICASRTCVACPVGANPCNMSQRCGKTSAGTPCDCVTSVDVATACVENWGPTRSFYCYPCDSDADCEAVLNLPGQAVCIGNCGGFDSEFCGAVDGTACAVKGCVHVETCDDPAECSTGACIDHRCQ